jgi:hypothetical protein
LWEFQQADLGDHVVVTSVAPLTLAQLNPFARETGALDYWAAELPSKKQQDADAFVVVMLFDAESFNRLGSTVFAKYPPIEVIRGSIAPADTGALLRQMEERHQVITFPRTYAELLSLLAKPSVPAARCHRPPIYG